MRNRPNAGPGRPLAVITGASSGLGAEFARALAARGYDLMMTARRLDRLEQAAGELSQKYGITTRTLAADLAQESEIEKIADWIAAAARIDLLVNNAGFGLFGDFQDTDCAAQIRMCHVHVVATMRLTHAALPRLIRQNDGGIVNVASVAGFARRPGHAGYGSTKAWIIAFTEAIHLELKNAGSRVKVQVLCPGYTYTEFHDVLGIDRDKVPMGKNWWMSAGFVVAEALKGFDRGKWLVIPGWRYRLLCAFLEKAPRPLIHPLVIKAARRQR